MPYLTRDTVASALPALRGTASHGLKIWLTLKRMGLAVGRAPVTVTTSNPTSALQDLFSYGERDGGFFVPFAHTSRFETMKGDAGRSIVQTTVKQWAEDTAVGVSPQAFLDIRRGPDNSWVVAPTRAYPLGLGHGENGFALNNGERVALPFTAFAVWYCRQRELGPGDPVAEVRRILRTDLGLTTAEEEAIFVHDEMAVSVRATPLTDAELNKVVADFLRRNLAGAVAVMEEHAKYTMRVKSMVTLPNGPSWLRTPPAGLLKALLKTEPAILLSGPPRTGKTRAIDELIPRAAKERETIQIHDGWGYDELMLGLRPKEGGAWDWKKGPLYEAVRGAKRVIVLEELNRTNVTQALGEVFSLLEGKYRGQENAIRLRDGTEFWIPKETLVLATMNTLDKSTEDLDDALLGRMACVEFPPRVEDLAAMLETAGVTPEVRAKLARLFAAIQEQYPLGHGYFAGFARATEPIPFYLARVRPVLRSQLEGPRSSELHALDNLVDELFRA